jgi:hypothetical protein
MPQGFPAVHGYHSRRLLRGLDSRLDFCALGKIDRWIEDRMVTGSNPARGSSNINNLAGILVSKRAG